MKLNILLSKNAGNSISDTLYSLKIYHGACSSWSLSSPLRGANRVLALGSCSALVIYIVRLTTPLGKGILQTQSRDGQAENLNYTIHENSIDLHIIILDDLFNTFNTYIYIYIYIYIFIYIYI